MEKSRLAAIWDDSEKGWYFRAEQHEGIHSPCSVLDLDDPYLDEGDLDTAAREHAIYCGVDPSGDVEIVR